jgi:hypothetical protein
MSFILADPSHSWEQIPTDPSMRFESDNIREYRSELPVSALVTCLTPPYVSSAPSVGC